MASYPVTVYRWDDPGAPQIVNGTISSFFNVLQKCLVDGYGDKAPLGWTRSFYDPATFKAAWRNDVSAGGSGGSAYFYSNTNTDVDSTVIRITSCKTITESGTVTGQGRLTALSFPIVINRWVLIGTAIGFYFYSFGSIVTPDGNGLINNNSARPAFYAGDIFSIVPNDAGRFIVFNNIESDSNDNISTGPATTLCYINIYPNRRSGTTKIWDADNYDSATTYGYFGSSMDDGSFMDRKSLQVYPLLLNRVVLISNTYWRDGNRSDYVDRLGVEFKNSTVRPAVRGVLPGLFVSINSFGYGQELPLIKNNSGVSYHTLPSMSIVSSSVTIIQSGGSWHDTFV